MALVLGLVLVGTGCSPGGDVTTATKRAHTVVPSAGCRRPAPVGAVEPGREDSEALVTGTVNGSYDLTVPTRYRIHRATGLILAFYGFASDPAQFSTLTGLSSGGSKDGYLVAVPHDHSGEAEWQFSGHGTDAAFVDALVVSLEDEYCVDESAVFAVGFSAGAAFTIAYACAHEHQIAAMVTVAVEFQLGCTRPMSILAFHGTEDPLVPYRNGATGLSLPGVKVRGTQLNMGDWARLDQCRANPDRVVIGSQVVRQQWEGCGDGTQVVLYTIVGGGHTWPGADPTKAVGLTTQQVRATAQALSFFDGFRSVR
jgi:polyhydroxybutyrate depolymerase